MLNLLYIFNWKMVSYKKFVKENEYIILELKCGDIFEGEVVNVGENLLELIKVRQHNNPNSLQGVSTFYRSEIERIFKLKTPNDENIYPKLFRMSKVDENEYNRLRNISENYIYLENADNRYYKAIEDLENSETIAVVPLGLNKSMTTDIKLLGICTFKQVYLFDMIHLKERSFYPELKYILESKLISKVFHGGIAFVDILFKNYKVYVANIFDTQITDLYIEKKLANGQPPKMAKSLAHCLKNYLNLPPSILKKPDSIYTKKWSERPLCEDEKLYASHMCTYIIKLQDVMKKKLLKNVFESINRVHNHVHRLSDADFEEYIKTNKITPTISNMIPFQKQQDMSKSETNVPDKTVVEKPKT